MGTPRLPHPFLLHQTCWRTAWRRRQQPVVPWFSGTYSLGAGLFQAKAVALSPACGRGYRTSPALRRVQCTLWAHLCPWPPGLDVNVLELTNTQETLCLPEAGPRGSVGGTTLGWCWGGAGVVLGGTFSSLVGFGLLLFALMFCKEFTTGKHLERGPGKESQPEWEAEGRLPGSQGQCGGSHQTQGNTQRTPGTAQPATSQGGPTPALAQHLVPAEQFAQLAAQSPEPNRSVRILGANPCYM